MKVKILLLNLILVFASLCSQAQSNLKIGDKAPEFKIKDPNGKELHLSDLKGKIVLIDFWASWCMPCRTESPELVELYNHFHMRGFDIFSISLDGRKEAWVKAIKNDKLVWPYHGSDLQGWENSVAQLYGVDAIPATFLIDENGIILAKGLDAFDLEKKLNYLFFEQVQMYPKSPASKLYFTGKTKYSIEDAKGHILLKNKGEVVDISMLPSGEYICRYEHKAEKFVKKTQSQSKPSFYPTNVIDYITISRVADFEIINQRGKVEKKGSGTIADMSSLETGVYYLNLEGELYKVFKK